MSDSMSRIDDLAATWRPAHDDEASANVRSPTRVGRVVHPARGRDGGGDGEPGRVYVKGGDDFRGKGRDVVPPGATLVMETPGGAGMGRADQRDRNLIAADVEAGLVSPEAARDRYGFDTGVSGDDCDGGAEV